MTQPGLGLIRFAAASRTFSVDGGPLFAGDSGDLALASVSNLVVQAGGGADAIDLGAFAGALPSFTVDGGAGDDSVSFLGDLDFATGASLEVDLQDDDPSPGVDVVRIAAGANVRVTGAGTITIRCSKSVSLTAGSSLEVVDGDLVLEANRQAVPTPGNFSGVQVAGSLIRSSGAGALMIRGRGGDDESGFQFGVWIRSGGDVIGGTSRPVAVEGTGGISLGPENPGVGVSDAGSTLTSDGGDVSVTGQGGGLGLLGGNFGVLAENGARISAGGMGTVMVDGTGGDAAGISNFGVLVYIAGATITSSGGDVRVTGQGGGSENSGFDDGVIVQASGFVTAGGMGSVTVSGTGGAATGNLNRGVDVNNTGSAITSGGGDVTIVGQGGGSGGSGSDFGVYVRNDGLVSAGAGGAVRVRGYAGASAGAPSHGVIINTGGTITSGGGGLSITGIEGPAPADAAIQVDLGAITTAANGGGVELVANSMSFGASSTVAAASGDTIALRPYTSGVAIDLGSATLSSCGPLTLSDAALDRVAAGTIVIGDTASGAITVSTPITRPSASNVELITGGDVRFDPGSLDLGGGALKLAPGAAGRVRPISAGADATASAITFATGATLALAVDGTSPDAGYSRLGVAGGVDLAGAALVVAGSYVPAVGDTFVVVDNDGADPVANTFVGLPEGAAIAGFFGSPLAARIGYAGGSGNDVVLTVFDPDPMTVLLSRFEIEAASDGMLLRWRFDAGTEVVAAWIERASDPAGPWTRLEAEVVIEDGISIAIDRAPLPGKTRAYRLVAEFGDGQRVTFAPTETGPSTAASVAGLARLSPNPTRGMVRIEFALARASRVRVIVLDPQGRLVARVLDERLGAGRHQAAWDGAGARGLLPAGLYFVRFESDGRVDVRRVLMVR